jgi:hypothetical protein
MSPSPRAFLGDLSSGALFLGFLLAYPFFTHPYLLDQVTAFLFSTAWCLLCLCYRKQRYSNSDTTLTESTLVGSPFLPGPSSSLARRAVSLFNPILGLFYTHKILLVIFHSLSGNRNSRVREFSTHNIRSFTSPKPDGQRVNFFFLIGDFPIGKSLSSDVNNLNLQSPMPDAPISDARVDLGLPPSGPSFPRTPVQLHLYYTKPRGPTIPRHFLLLCDRELRDRGFTGRNSFASQNPECRILTFQDLMPPVPKMFDGSD